ncbi:hypothetical protein KAT92_00150 [Candidatus Babeliales bacterium]|nr:hypothetical protein [Candidatus Babeliales bacterium]
MKKLFIGLAVIALFSSGHLLARRGDVFGGFAGGMAGSMIGSAITQPHREKTVIVERQAPIADYSRAEMDRLREDVRDLKRDLGSIERENSELRDENRNLNRELIEALKKR